MLKSTKYLKILIKAFWISQVFHMKIIYPYNLLIMNNLKNSKGINNQRMKINIF